MLNLIEVWYIAMIVSCTFVGVVLVSLGVYFLYVAYASTRQMPSEPRVPLLEVKEEKSSSL